MDKNKARKMYELADRLSKLDTSKLNEQQLAERNRMIENMRQVLQTLKEAPVMPQDNPAGQTPGIPAAEEPPKLSQNSIKQLAPLLGVDADQLRAAIMARIPNTTQAKLLAGAFRHLMSVPDAEVRQAAVSIMRGNRPDIETKESAEITAEAEKRVDKIFDFSDFKG